MAKRNAKRSKEPRGEGRNFGDDLVEAMTQMRDALASGDPASYPGVTVRVVEYNPPPKLTPAAVQRIRRRSKLSRVAFAGAVGVTPVTVDKWERGERTPAGSAARALQVMTADPEHYLRAVGRPPLAPPVTSSVTPPRPSPRRRTR